MKQLDELLLEVGANGELLQELLVALRAPCPRVEQVEVGG